MSDPSCGYYCWAFAQKVVPRETQAPLWGWLTTRSGLMPENERCCRIAIEKPIALWDHVFSFEDFNLGYQLHSISRRTFLSLGLSIPLLARSGSNQDDKQTPISMSRCLWLTDGPDSAQRVIGGDSCRRLRESTSWHCEMIAGDLPMKDWWLLVVQHQNADPLLKVLQPSSAIPDSPQLLAARITFRLHVLQRRGFDVESLSKRQLVSVVNQLIRNAMKKMPA